MATIIEYGHREHNHRFMLSWDWRDNPHSGFSFECNEAGEVLDQMQEAGHANLQYCKDHPELLSGPEIVRYDWSYWQPTRLKCDCGREVLCADVLTNVCECGLLYNGFGQALAPISQWGEDVDVIFGGGFDRDYLED